MQRILSRGEIESLDHTLIPRVRLPELASVFADRAARLRLLAADNDNPLQRYLELMAHLADAQQRALGKFTVPGPDASRLSLAQTHGMPPLQAVGWQRDPVWHRILGHILAHMMAVEDIPEQAKAVCQHLQEDLAHRADRLETTADAILARLEGVDNAQGPFVMAALQVYWTYLAGQLNIDDLPVVLPFGVCPCCGALPVASVVRVGAQVDGCRYLNCALCATEWHLVRVTCSHCEATEKIAYHSIEGGPAGIKAESCDHCQSYHKIFYQEKAPTIDAVADDLASLSLDILMGEAGYSRVSDNPLLWQNKEA